MRKFSEYIREVLIEMRKVTWPTRNELVESTWVVMGFSLLVGLFIYAVDLGVGFVVEKIFSAGA